MRYRCICVGLLVAITCAAADAPATQPTSAPQAPVTGTMPCVRPAATGIKITSSNWPDASDAKAFGDDAIRLERATTDEEKAVAIWRWIRRVTMATGGLVPSEPGDRYIYEPALILNVYGAHYCDGLSRVMASCWHAQGWPAEKLYRNGHTMAECYWVDRDGVGRYHMFDLNYGYVVHSRDGGHIASAEEIGLDFSLVAFPSRNSRPWIEKQWWMWAWIWAGWPADAPYDATLSLRAGERVRRLWGNVGKPYCDNTMPADPDVDSASYPMSYGNGVLDWSVDFGNDRWRDKLILPPTNAEVHDGRLVAADGTSPAEIVCRVRSPYVVAECELTVGLAAGGTVGLDVSVDGGLRWTAAFTGRCGAGARTFVLSELLPKFSGPPSTAPDRPLSVTSPLGRYDFLVRLRLSDGAAATRFAVATTVQLNYHVLPNLVPGANRIRVSGQLVDDAALEVTYVFDDADAVDKRCVVRAEALPYEFDIAASGRRWKDVRCRSLTVRVVPRTGQGSAVLTVPAAPRVVPDGPMPELDVRVLNSITPEMAVRMPNGDRFKPSTSDEVWARNREPFAPPLETAAEYIRDLSSLDDDTRRVAAAGLTVLRDASAWDALTKVAVEDRTRAKYYAIQALYWTDAKRAWPVMEKVLRADPSIRYADEADTRAIKELPTFVNVAAMVATMAGRSRIKAASPLICELLDSRPAGNWSEARWALIRSLGRIGDPESAPTLRRFLARRAGGDTQIVAAEALIALGDRESLPQLIECLSVKGLNHRVEVGLAAVIRFRPSDCTGRVLPHLSSPRGERRALTADALAACGDPDTSLPALRDALAREQFRFARDAMVRAIAAIQSRAATQQAQ